MMSHTQSILVQKNLASFGKNKKHPEGLFVLQACFNKTNLQAVGIKLRDGFNQWLVYI